MKKLHLDIEHWKNKNRDYKNDIKNLATINLLYAGIVVALILFNGAGYMLLGFSVLYSIIMYMIIFGISKAQSEETKDKLDKEMQELTKKDEEKRLQ